MLFCTGKRYIKQPSQFFFIPLFGLRREHGIGKTVTAARVFFSFPNWMHCNPLKKHVQIPGPWNRERLRGSRLCRCRLPAPMVKRSLFFHQHKNMFTNCSSVSFVLRRASSFTKSNKTVIPVSGGVYRGFA
jgi:hypothetical protein